VAEGADNYSRGWCVDGAVLSHHGSNTMNYAIFEVYPESAEAIIAVCNTGDHAVTGPMLRTMKMLRES